MITALADQSGAEGDGVSLQVRGADQYGPSFELQRVGLPSGLSMSSTGLSPGPRGRGRRRRPVSRHVTATDGTYPAPDVLWHVTAPAAADSPPYVPSAGEAAVGAAATAAPEPVVTKAVGYVAVFDAADNFASGVHRLIFGDPEPRSAIAEGVSGTLQSVGVKPQTANALGRGVKSITTATGLAAGAYEGAGGRLATMTPEMRALEQTNEEIRGLKLAPSSPVVSGKPAYLTPEEFAKLPEKGTINASRIRTSQDTASWNFKPPYNNSNIGEAAYQLREGAKLPSEFGSVKLVEKDGMIWSVDNRRVLTFRSAGTDIPYEKTTWDALTPAQKSHFTSNTNGESIIILLPK